MRLENEFADDHVHENVELEKLLAEFLYKALRHEEKRLRQKKRYIEEHHELAWLALSSPQLELYQQRYKWTSKFRQLVDELLHSATGSEAIQLGDMMHGMLRKLKAIGLAYIGFLNEELHAYGEHPLQAPPVYQDVEADILRLKERLDQKPFEGVSPEDLLP